MITEEYMEMLKKRRRKLKYLKSRYICLSKREKKILNEQKTHVPICPLSSDLPQLTVIKNRRTGLQPDGWTDGIIILDITIYKYFLDSL